MSLTSELISQFVKATKDDVPKQKEATVYGTTVEYEGVLYVLLDGSDRMTPASTTTNVKPNERVVVNIKNHTATITGNLSPDGNSARTDDVKNLGNRLDEFDIIVANKATIEQLIAEQARINNLVADNVTIKERLTATEGNISSLSANYLNVYQMLVAKSAEIESLKTSKLDVEVANMTYASIGDLEATNADIHNLNVDYGSFKDLTADKLNAVDVTIKNLDATYATIESLEAERARINVIEADYLTSDSIIVKNLTADVADINTLIFGSASGDVIQTSFANAVIAQLGNAQIRSAMIDNLSASKIMSGLLNTEDITIGSPSGRLRIWDNTIQIKDTNSTVRVQIGFDASGDYSMNVWDASGNLMFSQGGITDSAIKEAIIRNDMVSDTANISASKLDISSLFEEINNSTHTIKSNRIYLDEKAQTIDVLFTEMSSDLEDISNSVTSQGTQLTIIQGQINSKVWQEDIDDATNTMSTKYTELQQDLNGLSGTVASHTTQILEKADSVDVVAVTNRVSDIELDLEGFKASVASTYSTKQELDDLKIGGRNLVRESSLSKESEFWKPATYVVASFTNGYCELYRTETNGSRAYLQQSLTLNPLLKPDKIANEMFTLSAEIKLLDGYSITNGSSLFYRCNSTEIERGYQEIEISLATATSEWQKVSGTLIFGDYNFDGSCQVAAALADIANTGICIRNVKLEKGCKATDWTPAPEDVESNVTTVSNQLAELELSVEGFKTTVSKTYATYEHVTNTVNDIQLGGRNLVYNTSFEGFVSEGVRSFGDGAVTYTVGEGESATSPQINLDFTEYGKKIIRGQKLTLSMEYKIDSPLVYGSTNPWAGFQVCIKRDETTGGSTQYFNWQGSTNIPVDVTNGWVRTSRTLTVSDHDNIDVYMSILFRDVTGTISYRHPKVEIGDKATDWTPAPEDVDKNISDVSASLTSQISEISSAADNILLSVEESTKNQNDLNEELRKDISSLKESAALIVTKDEIEMSIKTEIEENGATKVSNTTGTFDENGLTVDKTNAPTKTRVSENGMTVYKKSVAEDETIVEEAVLTANSDGVDAENLHATTYLIVGKNSRFEDYDGNRTGCFWIGG